MEEIRDNEGKWLNSNVFRQSGEYFMKHGYYCNDPWESPDWFDFWVEERRRCIEGYTVGNATITGDHYFYLNYSPIQKVEDTTKKKSNKIKGFPDFWDGDFEYFWIREIAKKGIFEAVLKKSEDIDRMESLPMEEKLKAADKMFKALHLKVQIKPKFLFGGWNLIVGKSRRKGYSYKAASIGAKNFFTIPNSLTIFGAYDKKYLYPKGIFSMSMAIINFCNANTGWATPSDVVNKPNGGHIRASYIEYKNGIKVERGFMSEIMALTFNDNADAARGKDATDVFFEESGAFGTPKLLINSYAATQDTVLAGAIKTGLITVFGTSGDMKGGTADYSKMFLAPEPYEFLPIVNIWDKDSTNQNVGFFHPVSWNMEGYYDKQGNSFVKASEDLETKAREHLVKQGATSDVIHRRMQEKPLSPSEAFGSISTNDFPILEIQRQIQRIKANDLQNKMGTPVELVYEKGEVVAHPVLKNSKSSRRVITSYTDIPEDFRGYINIYEFPVPDAPKGLYKIGYDPIRQEEGTSLAAIIVYKGVHIGTTTHDIPVAEYIGRLHSPNDIDQLLVMLCEYYNTTAMHENEVPGVVNYFRRVKKLHLLAGQPDAVISKNIKISRVARVWGCHMVDQLKAAGERYTKDWLIAVVDYDENGTPVTVVDRIYSLRLLEELVDYNRKGNFDLISALFMCLFQVQEQAIGKEYGSRRTNKTLDKLSRLIDESYIK